MSSGWAGTWGPYQALHHRFCFRSTSAELGTYLDEAYGALRVDGPCTTWYGVDHLGRFGPEPGVLVGDEVAYATPEASALLPWLVWRINQDVVATGDDIVVHASAVQVDEGAMLFVGPSGVGKSTLSALLARRGCAYVTDEAVAITEDGSACPYPKPLALAETSIDLLAIEPGRLPDELVRPTTEHLVDPRRLGPIAVEPLPIRALVVLERPGGHDDARIVPIARSQAVAAVAAHLLRPSVAGPQALRVLAAAAEHAACARIVLGTPTASASGVLDLVSTTRRGGRGPHRSH